MLLIDKCKYHSLLPKEIVLETLGFHLFMQYSPVLKASINVQIKKIKRLLFTYVGSLR